MTTALSKPTIGSTDWGTSVNNNWTTLENEYVNLDGAQTLTGAKTFSALTMIGTLSSRSIVPTIDNTYNLGSSTFRVAHAYMAGFETHLPGHYYLYNHSSDGTYQSQYQHLYPLGGDGALISRTYLRGWNGAAGFVNIMALYGSKRIDFNADLFPSSSATYDLGSSSLGWRNLFLSGGSGGTTNGEIWQDSTQAAFAGYVSGIKQMLSGVIFTSTATATVANTTTETSIIGSGVGTRTLPAFFFVIGKTIRITVRGILSDTGTPTLNFKVKLGSTAVAITGALALAGTINNNAFSVICDITCRTAGSSGTIIAVGHVVYDESTHGGTTWGMAGTGTTVINTHASLAMDITATWGTSSANNTISGQICTVEVIN